MSTQIRAFRPLAATQNIAVTASAQTVTLNYSLGTPQIRFCNIGTQTVFIVLGDNSSQIDATAANAVPIPAGQTEIFRVPPNCPSYSVIAGATGSTLYSTVGEGI
jgi:hypothetical protein